MTRRRGDYDEGPTPWEIAAAERRRQPPEPLTLHESEIAALERPGWTEAVAQVFLIVGLVLAAAMVAWFLVFGAISTFVLLLR